MKSALLTHLLAVTLSLSHRDRLEAHAGSSLLEVGGLFTHLQLGTFHIKEAIHAPPGTSEYMNGLELEKEAEQHGSGVYGQVFKAKVEQPGKYSSLSRGQTVIIKIVRKADPEVEHFKILYKLSNSSWGEPNPISILPTFYGFKNIEGSYQMAIIMEYIEGEPVRNIKCADFAQHLGKFWEQLQNGIKTWQAPPFQMCHSDLNPGNIMMTNTGDARVIDLGLAGFLDKSLYQDLQPEDLQSRYERESEKMRWDNHAHVMDTKRNMAMDEGMCHFMHSDWILAPDAISRFSDSGPMGHSCGEAQYLDALKVQLENMKLGVELNSTLDHYGFEALKLQVRDSLKPLPRKVADWGRQMWKHAPSWGECNIPIE